jgi:hypothetical protein
MSLFRLKNPIDALAGVTIKLGMYDEVYETQYGKFEKSYEMKFDKEGGKDVEPEKKKNMFGF